MYMLIEPLDVLFFRDSRPFGAGDNHTGQGGQMPAAQPFAGAVRSAVLAEILASRGQSFQAFGSDEKLTAAAKEIGTPDSYGDFSLRGPFAAQQDNGAVSLQLPLPLDLLREKDEQESVTVRGMLPLMGMLDKVHRRRRETAPLWLRQEVPPGPLSDKIVLDKQLGQYLKNDNGRPQMHADSGFTTTEKRVGIALTADRNAEPGHLYATEFLRLQEQSGLRRGFVVQTNVVSLPEQGLLKLGGEGRAAQYTCLPDHEPQDWLSLVQGKEKRNIKAKVVKNKFFKLYLATPALFAQGWLPDFIDPQTLTLKQDSLLAQRQFDVRLVSAAVGKPLSIGGWDLAKQCPKPMYKAVPGGSVYFCECLAGDMAELFELFHGSTVLQQCSGQDDLAQLAAIGYGFTLVGSWQPVMEVR